MSWVLSGTSWQLKQIDTVSGGTQVLEQGDTILLRFDNFRHLSGESPGRCGNTYSGVYSIPSDYAICTDSLVKTEIYCGCSKYHYYFSLLTKAEKYLRNDSSLEILCDNFSRRLVLRRIQ